MAGKVREFVEQTEGLLLVDLTAISQLAKRESIPVTKVANAVRNYKVGVTEDPWLKIPKAKIKNGETFIQERVKGQDHAVVHMMDIIKRAVTGVGADRRGGRPRGVAFLAGPTGVGKTELAKTVTSLLFNDENSYIRFDMSEFSAEHADQRLIGAPPGYVGYDAGGELTNAIRERPFSVVLFDEIEKAHPRILDKFLQILDDGVLTSGRGERVYFSEALILFTSNLGIYKLDENRERVLNVAQTESYQGVQTKVRSEIDRHFKQVINRPELLNRMGENIIVFDFVRDDVAVEIFNAMVTNTLKDIAAQDIYIGISDTALAQLMALCLADLSNGGRGIRNKVEAHLINPLARALFDTGLAPGSKGTIVAVNAGKITQLELREGRT
jgi:ATP-dependent Clp protease ATP-binding subunit ClpA